MLEIDTRLNIPTLVVLLGLAVSGIVGYANIRNDIDVNLDKITEVEQLAEKNQNRIDVRREFMTDEKVNNERITAQLEQVIQTQEVIRANQSAVREEVQDLTLEVKLLQQEKDSK